MNKLLNLTTLLFILLFCGCKHKQTASEGSDMQGEVIITGHVKNRDFYPHVEEIVLNLPFFRKGQVSYTAPIDKDDSFYFNFQLDAKICEVSIKPYMEHLYVEPGDSIHLEIDFKDMLHPGVTGNGAELNRLFTLFTEGGYYMQRYSIWGEYQTKEEFDRMMEQKYQERLNRYEEYIQKHQPTETVKQYISEMLKADYYTTLYDELMHIRNYGLKGIDIRPYAEKLHEAASLLESQVITGAHFRLAEEMYRYLHATNERLQAYDQTTTLEDVLSPMKDTPAMPYLFANGLTSSLYQLNDTTYFNLQKENFDRYIQSPYLRSSILKLQQSKKNFQENPKPVSDFILYGRYQDGVKALRFMSYMEPFYDLLNKHRGKMIYLDFWVPWCPPCLAEMKPLKELRQKYHPEDIVFITICDNENKERIKEILDTNGMHVPGIEHIMATDWPNNDELYKMYKQLNVDAYPYYFIINREGVIVNYGSTIRPSYPGTAECIDKWLK